MREPWALFIGGVAGTLARAWVAEAPARSVPAGAADLVVSLGPLAAWLGRELGLRF